MRDVAYRAPGNDQVILGLERTLERARLGAIRAATVIICEHMSTEAAYFGDENARININFGIDMLKRAIMDDVARTGNKDAPANQVLYDFNKDPISFDFIPWLATAEMARRREGASAPLNVSFVAKPPSIMTPHDNNPFIDSVIRPAVTLFGAVENTESQKVRHPFFVGLRDVGRAHANGEEVPQLVIPQEAAAVMRTSLQGRNPVTITLRESERHPQRNSNLDEWYKFAMWLCESGEDVVFVRDTAMAHETIPGFAICPEASTHLHTRAALYTQAKCNCFVANGPFALAIHTQVPWLLFASVGADDPEECHKPENWHMVMPTNGEGQLPWATARQRVIYEPDKFEAMRAAYEALYL
jgi:hypothetical protein